MYYEKLEPILGDLESKEIEIAGGSVVGMVISTINSLITYICNLTLGKKKYDSVQNDVQNILKKANELKLNALRGIDGDKEVLENILNAYKVRSENEEEYIRVCKEAVEFCEDILNIAFNTLKLADEISKVGNRMLASDFKICKYYSYASIQSAIVNVEINLSSINDEEYKSEVKNRCDEILDRANNYME